MSAKPRAQQLLLIWLMTAGALHASAAGWSWVTAPPEQHDLSTARLETLWSSLERDHSQAFLLIRDDKVVFERYTAGFSRTKPHYTASMAKAVVGGLSVACGLSDGSLDLDEPAAKYAPAWKNEAIKPKITLRHLGSHTSGIEDAEEGKLAHDRLTGWKGDFWKRLPPPADPFTLAREAKGLAGMKIYFDCGDADTYGFDDGARALDELLKSRRVAHEFHIYPGGHNWDFVAEHLGASMEFHSRAFGLKPAK